MIAQIANIPKAPEELAWWAFSHMAHHRDLNRAILQQRNTALPEYVLDPINPNDMGAWIDQHQQMHNNMNRVLNISGNDLLNVDWRNPQQLSVWIWLNFTEHQAASNILGV